MTMAELSGVTEISDEGIKKHFRNTEPHGALFELIWNGFDAKANSVDVQIAENLLGRVEAVTILDDGDGIDIGNIKRNFGQFNDSEKKEDAAQHGLHGRGRLAFHRVCYQAKWYTKSESGEALIEISSDNIKRYKGGLVDSSAQHPLLHAYQKGTCVELGHFHKNLPEHKSLLDLLSAEFGWFLALHAERQLRLGGDNVHVPSHEVHRERIQIDDVDFQVSIIRWDERPASEKSYTYLMDSSGSIVHKQLSTLNNKPNFFTSVYVQSPWADDFAVNNGLFTSGSNTPESEQWRILVKRLTAATRLIYDNFLRRLVDAAIESYVQEGIFPSYGDVAPEYAAWRLENTKTIVRSIYIADPTVFNSLNKKQKKVVVRLLDRLAISNENDSLFDVLNSVLDLDAESVRTLALQLKRTTLENIVSTIELLQRRQSAVHEIRELMNVHYMDVLETPDLQKIIENNTWLFGHRYETLGAEEATFTKVAKSLRDAVPAIGDIEQADVEADAEIEGARRQSDLFLARKVPSVDSFGRQIYRCVVVEIKRPGIALGIKHLRQLDDYATIIKRHPEFNSDLMYFDLILVGRKISSADTEIASRMEGQITKGEMGLVSDDKRMKRYVLNWYTLLDGFELANNFMLERLKLQRDCLSAKSKDELVIGLQAVAA